MVKILTAISLIAVAVFWSSASARPHHKSEQNDFDVDELAEWLLKEAEHEPEPFKTKFKQIVQEARSKHWNSAHEFLVGISPAVFEIDGETSDENTRRKRSDESISEEKIEWIKNLTGYQIAKLTYIGILTEVAPPRYQSALLQELVKVYNKEYETEGDFLNEARRVFKEVTGDNVEKYEDELEELLSTNSEEE